MATLNPAAAGVPYRVPPEPSRVPSFVMAAVVHAGLLLFLWAGIKWQNTAPVSVEAEVWDMKTQQAAPAPPPEPVRPPEPVPVPKVIEPEVERPVAPKPPDIALERIKEKKQKLLEKKLAEEKLLKEKQKELADEKAQELADKKAKDKSDKLAKAAAEAAEKKKRDKDFDATLKRLAGQAGGGKSPQATSPRIDKSYFAKISAKVYGNLNYAGSTDVPGDPEAVFEIRQLPTGEVLSAKLVRSSGIPLYDEAARKAIEKSTPLPKKDNGTVDPVVPIAFRLKVNSN